jgi:hypothetical protein
VIRESCHAESLKQLLVELDKFDSRERTAFENDLHSELLHRDKILATRGGL